MNVSQALRNVPVFADLDEETFRIVGSRAQVRRYAAGQYLLREQREGTALYVLLEGKVSVQRQTPSGRTILIAMREPGDHFGEMSLLDGKGHSADVLAMAECQVLIVSRQTFLDIVAEHPSVAMSVIRTLTGRLREQTGELTKARSLDLMGKVCVALLGLANEEGMLKGVTQQQLANQTGATREAVNRTLQALRDAEHIEMGRGFIRLKDRKALARRGEEPGS